MKEEYLKIIKENSYLKYCIICLLERIQNCREYKDLKQYLTDIIIPENKKDYTDDIFKRFFEKDNNLPKDK